MIGLSIEDAFSSLGVAGPPCSVVTVGTPTQLSSATGSGLTSGTHESSEMSAYMHTPLFSCDTNNNNNNNNTRATVTTSTTGRLLVPGTFVEVYDPDFLHVISVASDKILHTPHPSLGVSRLVLCRNFSIDNPQSSCAKAETCKFVHADTSGAKRHPIHVNYAWRSEDLVQYPRLPAGETLLVLAPNERPPAEEIPSERVLVTRGSLMRKEHDGPLSHCAHYYFNRMCNRGERCNFIHSVLIDPNASDLQRAPAPTTIAPAPRQQQQTSSKGRLLHTVAPSVSSSFSPGPVMAHQHQASNIPVIAAQQQHITFVNQLTPTAMPPGKVTVGGIQLPFVMQPQQPNIAQQQQQQRVASQPVSFPSASSASFSQQHMQQLNQAMYATSGVQQPSPLVLHSANAHINSNSHGVYLVSQQHPSQILHMSAPTPAAAHPFFNPAVVGTSPQPSAPVYYVATNQRTTSAVGGAPNVSFVSGQPTFAQASGAVYDANGAPGRPSMTSIFLVPQTQEAVQQYQSTLQQAGTPSTCGGPMDWSFIGSVFNNGSQSQSIHSFGSGAGAGFVHSTQFR